LLMRWRRRVKSGFVVSSWKKKTFCSGIGTLKCLRLRQVLPRPLSKVTRRRQYQLCLNANSSGKQCFDSPVTVALTKANDYYFPPTRWSLLARCSQFLTMTSFLSLFLFFIFSYIPKWVLTFDENRRYNILTILLLYPYSRLTWRYTAGCNNTSKIKSCIGITPE